MTTEAVTQDSVMLGALPLWQPLNGYRVNIDSVLLAAFAARSRRGELALDLGAGVGALGLTLVQWGLASRVVLIECQPALAALAQRNMEQARVAGEVLEMTLGDEEFPPRLVAQASSVISNPPFSEDVDGRQSEHLQQKQARFGPLLPFLQAAAQSLANAQSPALFAYPARSLQTFLGLAERQGLFAKRLRLVHAHPTANARLALVELRVSKPGGLHIEPALVEWAKPGERSPEFLAFIQPPAIDPA